MTKREIGSSAQPAALPSTVGSGFKFPEMQVTEYDVTEQGEVLDVKRTSFRTSRSFERPMTFAELERECFALSAGVCKFMGGNDYGNAMCLATGGLIETMKAAEIHRCTHMRLAEGEFSGGRQVRCEGTYNARSGVWYNTCGEPCRCGMQKQGEGNPPWPAR